MPRLDISTSRSGTSRSSFFCVLLAVLCLAAVMTFISCGVGGGGGGGGDDQELSPAQASLSAVPQTIDSGDRMRVEVKLSEIDGDGILLKLQFPTALHFVSSSAELSVDGDDVPVTPAFVITTGNPGSEKNYLVFDLSHDAFGNEHSAQLSIILEGRGEVAKESVVAVDPDFNDPKMTTSQKFSALAPQFDAAASVEVRVRDTSGLVTPTATATFTASPTATTTPTPVPTKSPKPTKAAT